MILKGAVIFVQSENGPKRQPEKEKRELGSRTPHKVFSKLYCTKGITKVKEKSAELIATEAFHSGQEPCSQMRGRVDKVTSEFPIAAELLL